MGAGGRKEQGVATLINKAKGSGEGRGRQTAPAEKLRRGEISPDRFRCCASRLRSSIDSYRAETHSLNLLSSAFTRRVEDE